MKILLVANGFPPSAYGGVEAYTFDLAQGLSRAGHEVAVFCRESNFTRSDYTTLEEVVGNILVTRVVNDYKDITAIRETFMDEHIEAIFVDYLRRKRPQLIHFNHLIALSARLLPIAEEQGIPTLITLHDFWCICQRVNLIDWRDRICVGPDNGGDCPTCVLGGRARRAISNSLGGWMLWLKRHTSAQLRQKISQKLPRGDRRAPVFTTDWATFRQRAELFRESISKAHIVLVPSNYVRSQFLQNGYRQFKMEVVPLGVNIPAIKVERTVSKNNLVFGCIAPSIRIKGVDILIRAFKQVENMNICLNLYGREDIQPQKYVSYLRRLAKGDERICFKGSFSPEQRAEVLEEMDVLVVPSRAPESFSLVAREALIIGKPVIASRIGALPEIVMDGVNGFLFDPGDEQGLAVILQRIADCPEILGQLSCPGPVPILTIDEHISMMERIYYQVLSSCGQ